MTGAEDQGVPSWFPYQQGDQQQAQPMDLSGMDDKQLQAEFQRIQGEIKKREQAKLPKTLPLPGAPKPGAPTPGPAVK